MNFERSLIILFQSSSAFCAPQAAFQDADDSAKAYGIVTHRANLQHHFQESPLPAGQYQNCCNISQAIQNQCFSIVLLGAILASFLVPLGTPVKAKEIFVAWLPQANIAAVPPFQVLFQIMLHYRQKYWPFCLPGKDLKSACRARQPGGRPCGLPGGRPEQVLGPTRNGCTGSGGANK